MINIQDIEEKRDRLRAMIPAGLPQPSTSGVEHIAVYAKNLAVTLFLTLPHRPLR